jgi:hypothetical protein
LTSRVIYRIIDRRLFRFPTSHLFTANIFYDQRVRIHSMKTERLILSFIAVLIGLLVAGAAFYFYQSTKVISTPEKKVVTPKATNTPIPESANVLVIDSPKEEEVVDKRIITISGKTTSDAIILVSTESDDQVVKPSANGNFSLSQTIGTGTNIISITAMYPTGEEKTVQRSVTFTTESF